MRIRNKRPLSSFYTIIRHGDRCDVTLYSPAGQDAGGWLADVYNLLDLPYRDDLELCIRYYYDSWLRVAAGLEAIMTEERREIADLVQVEQLPDGSALVSLRALHHTALDDEGLEVYFYELRQYTDIWREGLIDELQADYLAAWARAGRAAERRAEVEAAHREDPAKALQARQIEAMDAIAGLYEIMMEV